MITQDLILIQKTISGLLGGTDWKIRKSRTIFWVKSERQFSFQYGNQRYFPDFYFIILI